MSGVELRRAVSAVAGLAVMGCLAGCGNSYRATIGSGNPTPVPTQPEYLPVVTSISGTVNQGDVTLNSAQGLATILDLSGDEIQVQVNTGIEPVALSIASGGGSAYVVNLGSQDPSTNAFQGSVSSFSVVTNLQNSQVNTTTLDGTLTDVFVPPPALPVTPCAAGTSGTYMPSVFSNGVLIYVAQTTGASLLPLSRNISGTGIPAVMTPVATSGIITNFTGLTGGTRTFAIERDSNSVDVIDLTSATQPYISESFTNAAGANFSSPTYGVTSFNGQRVFVMNCNASVSVIDAQSLTYLTTIPISAVTTAGGATVPAGNPVWGDYYNSGSMLVTANTNGAAVQGTASVINATQSSTTQFGSTLGTAVVGFNPSGVTVLQDGSRAYVANENGDSSQNCCKSVSVVSLTSQTTINTIPLTYTNASGTVTCPVTAPGSTSSTTSSTGYPLQVIASPDTVDQQVLALCDQPSSDGNFYVFAIQTYASTGGVGQSTNADTVVAAIPIEGIPTQIKLTPAR